MGALSGIKRLFRSKKKKAYQLVENEEAKQKTTIQELVTNVKGLQGSLGEVNNELKENRKEIAVLKTSVTELKTKLEMQESGIKTLQTETRDPQSGLIFLKVNVDALNTSTNPLTPHPSSLKEYPAMGMSRKDYTVGWICALPKEQTAATAMLDKIHPELPKPAMDKNAYTLGSVGHHNTVIACLPKGQIGNNAAGVVAAQMLDTFPSIRVGLMVGIGGGIPPKVRLGDVVVSSPSGEFSGVVQWDLGKKLDGGKFERTGSLDTPPRLLLTALSKLETDNEMYGSKIPRYLEELVQRYPRLKDKYSRSELLKDMLFEEDYSHPPVTHSLKTGTDDEARSESCQSCDKSQVVQRPPRDTGDMPVVHYGLIASGNQVIKDSKHRTMLNSNLGGQVLCVEMEAAGLMNSFPCIVVRGICDYADSHKNKDWQEYAAAVAAAFAKELLGHIQAHDMKEEPPAKSVVSPPPADIHVPMPPPANNAPASRLQANNNPTTNNSHGTRLLYDWDADLYGLYLDTGGYGEDIYDPYLGDASAQNPYIDGLSADYLVLASLSAEYPYMDAWNGY